MRGKTVLGVVLTGIVLFVFGFLYWALNPLPYQAWNDIEDPAVTQAAAAGLFPEDGVYFVPGGANDPQALELLKEGPSIYLTIDHSPMPGNDPVALGLGLLHNVFSAVVLVFLLSGVAGLGERVSRSMIVGVIAVFVVNGSEIIWWQQPVEWVAHQSIYYLLYFALAATVLHFFLPPPDPADMEQNA